jgi:hypothetical protein
MSPPTVIRYVPTTIMRAKNMTDTDPDNRQSPESPLTERGFLSAV